MGVRRGERAQHCRVFGQPGAWAVGRPWGRREEAERGPTTPGDPPPAAPPPTHLHLLKHHAALLVEHAVHAAHGLLRALDLHQVDWLQQPRLGGQLSSVHGAAGGGDDLAAAAVDGVGVEHHVAHLRGAGVECGVSREQ